MISGSSSQRKTSLKASKATRLAWEQKSVGESSVCESLAILWSAPHPTHCVINAGATGEYHLVPGTVSPYVGGYAVLGYMRQNDSIAAVPFSLGVVAGVEVFIFDFLSIFAEYTLAFDFIVTNDLQTSQTTFDYLVDTRIGNSSKIGIVVYLMRIGVSR